MDRNQLATALALQIVEVDGSGVEQGRTYTEKNTGLTKPLRGRQNAFLWQGAKYPIAISVDIPDGKGPYAPGQYLLAGSIFESGKFGRLEFKGTRDAHLIPLKDALDALTGVLADEAAASKKAA